MFGQKRNRMEFEDVSEDEDTKPATKGVKVEEESDVLALDVLRAGPETSKGDVKNEEETLDVKPPKLVTPVRFSVQVVGDSRITKTNAKEMFHLGQGDFEGLHFDKTPLIRKPYFAHLYDIIEIWKRAIELKRIPRDTPRPQIGPHIQHLTMAQALTYLPGCAEIDEHFAPWIWRAIARFYERTLDLHTFIHGGTNNVIAHQLRVGVDQELNKMYSRWPRTTAPLLPSQSVTMLQDVLGRAPLMWTKNFKTQVNDAVIGVVGELGGKYETTARWLVYDKLAVCNDGLHWDRSLGRWVDNAVEVLEGPFKV